MTLATASLLALALLVQPQPALHRWRDAQGQVHITTTPPPADAEVLEPPQSQGVEQEKTAHPELVRQSASKGNHRQVSLSPAQEKAWKALDQKLAQARAAGDYQTLEAVADSLMHDCLWGHGLWVMPIVPILSVLLMGLLGWWLALGLRTGPRLPLIVGFLLLGFGLGHLLLNVFLYHPQATRLRQNLELFELHLGTGKPLRTEQQALLQQRYQALGQAAEPSQVPWRFPGEVASLRAALKQVMVEP